jgi:hypothetical protein
MIAKNQALELQIDKQSIKQVEHFVYHLCDILKINVVYFGSILMSLTEFFNLLVELNRQKTINITYVTNYSQLKVNFRPVDKETVKTLNSNVDLTNVTDSELNKSIFILNKLADNIVTDKNKTVSLVFDISALHNLVYDDLKNVYGYPSSLNSTMI